MADLPTQEELKQLYHAKGHDALVWYLWRRALRVTPVLGRLSLQEIWPTQTIQHTYAVGRIWMLLAQWNQSPIKTIARDNAYTAADAAYDTRADSTRGTVYTIRAAADAYTFRVDINKASSARASGIKADLIRADAYAAAAKSDFQYLEKHTALPFQELALWPSGSTKPKEMQKWEQNLLNNLKRLNLDFLANDIHSLWEAKPLGTHAKNYFKDLSETITNDPILLRRAILYGETTEQIQAVRVLLLGSGGAGKTTLAKRLKGEKNTESYQAATIGVDYQKHQALKLNETLPELELKNEELDLYLWDFGGQTIFHGLHSAFLHENCVYVLVVDNRHEQAPEEWLYQIRHLAGSQAKVLLVTNEYENCYARQNEARLLREFSDLLAGQSFFYFSCFEPDPAAFKHFVEHLIQTCLESRRSVFASTMQTQKALTAQYEQKIFLHETYVARLIDEQESQPETVLKQLTQLGFLVSVKSGGLQYCLKPAWAVDNAYKLLHAEPLRSAGGLASIRDLSTVMGDQVEPEHVDYLADFLNERSLCCLLPNKSYFFPDAAPASEPILVQDLLAKNPNVVLRFDLPYLPLGFHARLVHQLFNGALEIQIKEVEHIWRHGFILSAPQAQAVIEYQLRKSSIELVLTGLVADFAKLFQAFYNALIQTVAIGSSVQWKQIHLSLLFNDQPFSVESSADFIAALKTAQTVKDLSEELSKMTGKGIYVGNNSQVIIESNNNTQKYNSDNTSIEISQDQRQQLAVLMDELLKTPNKSKEVKAIATVQEALENPEKPESKSLLGKVWSGVKEVAVFAKDTGIPIAEKVAEHKEAIIGAVVTAASLIS